MRTPWESSGRHFTDPTIAPIVCSLCHLLRFITMASPFHLDVDRASVEMDGVWSVQGGMHALARRPDAIGSGWRRFVLNMECERIELNQGRVSGVRLQSGDSLRADSVVFDGDMLRLLRQGLLGPGVKGAVTAKKQARSLSAITWSMHTPTAGLGFQTDTMCFSDRITAKSLKLCLIKGVCQPSPTVYVCAQDRGTGELVRGPERLLCLVDAPANGDKRAFTPQELADCTGQQPSLDGALWSCHYSWSLPSSCIRTTPQDFHQLFPATGGALYGQATHGWMAAFARSNAKAQVPGLYLAGGKRASGARGYRWQPCWANWRAAAVMDNLGSTKSS
jgi:1-hydroxycarotenoid 3,4-desaturase